MLCEGAALYRADDQSHLDNGERSIKGCKSDDRGDDFGRGQG